MAENEPKQYQVALILALSPIRPKVDCDGYILDRGAVLALARELSRHARNPTVKAIKIEVKSAAGVAISIASR